jgi:hypothetical protein
MKIAVHAAAATSTPVNTARTTSSPFFSRNEFRLLLHTPKAPNMHRATAKYV